MVKLASARESRLYGPRLVRNRSEYMNAGLYVFAAILLLAGFSAYLSSAEPQSGLVLLLVALPLVAAVNVHDLVAHLAGIDFRLPLMGSDVQLALVECAVPVVQTLGSLLMFVAVLFIIIQAERREGYFKLERHALNMLIAGPTLWVLGSIHNACQIYERADGHFQILQHCVHVPLLMGSLLFLVGSVLNSQEQAPFLHHGLDLLGRNWGWLGVMGGALYVVAGLMNVVKVFKMQQTEGRPLEKLRGGAQERLMNEREGQGRLGLIIQEERLRPREPQPDTAPRPILGTPYKDVLIGRTR